MKLKSIKKTNRYQHIEMNDIKNDWQEKKIYTPSGFVEINDFFFTKRNKTVVIQIDTGMKFKCDPNHQLQIFRNNIKIKEFAKNLNSTTDRLVGYNGFHRFTVDCGPEEDLYDISIDDPHWYYTSGIVSHNSIVICNNVAACVKMGLNVLHVTCELSWYKTACRYLGIFSKMNIKERFKEKNKKYILETIDKVKRSYDGRLVIHEFPPDMITIRTISSLIDSLKKKKGWTPDVIAVDYLELLLSDNEYFNRDEYKRQKKVSTEIRQLAKTSGTFIITATQTNRGKEDSGDDLIDINRVSESFGKMMPVDYVVSINQSRTEYGTHKVTKKDEEKDGEKEELEELDGFEDEAEVKAEKKKEEKKEGKKEIDWRGMRLYIAKNRNGPKFKTVKTVVNFNTMFMQEITEGETK